MGKQAEAVVASRPIERIAQAVDATNSWPIFGGRRGFPHLPKLNPRRPAHFP